MTDSSTAYSWAWRGCELVGRAVAERRVLSVEAIVPHVFRDGLPSRRDIVIFGDFQLALERSPARFDERVVVAVVRAAHALHHLGSPQKRSVLRPGVLPAAIAVMHQARPR